MEVVERMRELRSGGMAYRQIAAVLNAEGVPTRLNGGRWRGCTVNGILNCRYLPYPWCPFQTCSRSPGAPWGFWGAPPACGFLRPARCAGAISAGTPAAAM